MDLQRDLILKSFLEESAEGFALMEQSILELESRPEDMELIQSVFRVVHTLKGNAGILELKHLLQFAHEVEDLLDLIRKGKLGITSESSTILLTGLDVLRDMTAAAGKGKDEASRKGRDFLKRLSRFVKEGDRKRKLKLSARTTGETRSIAKKRSRTDRFDEGQNHAPDSQHLEVARTLRVDIEKLDRLLNLAGEITIARGRMSQLLTRSDANLEELREAQGFADALHLELQETILRMRMVSVGPLFRQFNRTVRDMARAHGKLAQLLIVGEDVEVDTSVVEHLKDPLLHMIRNAVDHGIEVPAERQKRGKPPAGSITVKAEHNGGNIVIEISDDGAGLSRERILEVAKKRRLVGEAVNLGDQDVYQLIFESGFSTASEVSDLSGRGVGMDVVRRNVQALRGRVHVTSQPGQGSTVHIRLPLTLAIIEGFGVSVGEETFVIPVDQVTECVELPHQEIQKANAEGILQLRNEPLPFVYLKEHFGISGEQAVRQNIVVVQHDSTRAGLAVDVLHGATQTVIKPLPAMFKEVEGVSGSAILGDGRVALILDVPALLRDFRSGRAQPSAFV